LFLERLGLPSPLLARCKRLAIIPNPEFHRREAMRMSVAGTPRLVRCFEEDEQYLSLPRGCEIELEQLARELGIVLEWEDQPSRCWSSIVWESCRHLLGRGKP